MSDITLVNMCLPESKKKNISVPLGVLYLAASLRQAGFTVDLRDYQLVKYSKPLDTDNICNFLSDSADIVGISCWEHLLPYLILALEKFKKHNPQKTIILGGAGATPVADELLQNFDFIDFVVRGEGEEALLELLKCLPNQLSKIQGISYRENGRVIRNPDRNFMRNIDNLPFPAYDMVDFKRYRRINMITSRGCPYNCSFCSVPSIWGRRNTERNIDNVISELELLRRKYKVRTVHIADDTFVLRKARVIEFCEKLRAKKIKVNWSCYGRINLMDTELMDVMKSAGCIGVFYGIETGSDKLLRKLHKGFTCEEALNVVKESAERFKVICSFIWGYPFETLEDFYETLIFLWYLPTLSDSIVADLFYLSPLAGSPLCREYCDKLKFSPNLVSSLVRTPRGRSIDKTVQTLIASYPNIFPGFYHFHSPDLGEKIRIAEKLSLI